MSTLTIRHARAFCPDRTTMTARLVNDATVVVKSGRIESIAAGGEGSRDGVQLNAQGGLLTPGLVDCHTHLLFLGDRAGEFCERAAGASYLEIAQRGGGIQSTVRATRSGPPELRVDRARVRLRRLLAQGITSVEVKSGYGLSSAQELSHLREIASLRHESGPHIFPTLMAAHTTPPEVRTEAQRADWVDEIATRLIPAVAREALAERVDVFVERSAYTASEARLIASAAKAHGLSLHVHVDQLSDSGGAQLAAELGAQAAAHLERISSEGAAALARSGTLAVLLPTATIAAGEPKYAPARELISAGVRVALSTNVNPGTAPSESTSLMFFLAAVGLHMTPAEILWAATRGGALALGRQELGLIAVGAPADLVLWNARDAAHLPYHAAVNHVCTVIKDGAVVLDRRAEADAACDGAL
jgi:imidazolonepropionase